MYNSDTLKKGSIRLYRTKNMCTFIKMEYLVANALVELYDKKRVDRISLDDIQKYGIKVEEQINSKENTRAILLYSDNYTKEFLHDYSDFFEKVDDFIKIKNGITIEDIREHILSYIPFDLLIVLFDCEIVDMLETI